MKKNNYLLMLFAAVFLTVVSCTESNEPDVANPTTVEEDKENIKANMDSFYSCLETLADGGFSDFFYKAIIKEDVETTHSGSWGSYTESESWINFTMEQFDRQFGPFNKDNGFNYNGLKGKYSWDIVEKKWERIADASIIELNFPSVYTGTLNNAVLIVDSYEDIEVSYTNEIVKLPTKGHLLVTVDNVKTFEIDIKEVTYDVNTNFSMPLKADIQIFTSPFTNSFKFNRVSPTKFNFTYSLSSEGDCGYTFNTDLELNTSDYGNVSSIENDLKKIKGYFSHNNLKITYSFDVTKVKALGKKISELSTNEINTILDSELLYNDIKISDITIDDKADFPFNMTFKDGEKESAEVYFGDFTKRIEEITKKYFN